MTGMPSTYQLIEGIEKRISEIAKAMGFSKSRGFTEGSIKPYNFYILGKILRGSKSLKRFLHSCDKQSLYYQLIEPVLPVIAGKVQLR